MKARLKRSETDQFMIELLSEQLTGTYLWAVIHEDVIATDISDDAESIVHELEQNGFADIEIKLACTLKE